MKQLQQAFFLTVCALLTLPVTAQHSAANSQDVDSVSFERVLVPLAIDRTAGAFGSIWISDLWVTSAENGTRVFEGDEICSGLCPPFALSPGQTRPVSFSPRPSAAPGLIVFIEQPSDRIGFYLRVHDVSRQALTWGTEIPVIRERDLLTEPARLINVPVGERFRHMLRMYALDSVGPAYVRVEVRDSLLPGTIAAADILLEAPAGNRHAPLYAQIADLIPPTVPHNGLVIEVTPLTPGLKFWTFISVTNNETQHVTTITPATRN